MSSLEHLIAAGFDLIPLRVGQKIPRDSDWRRRVYAPDDLREWVLASGNIGVRLRADQLVLDHDPRNDLIGDSLIRFAADHGIDLALCPRTLTPTGGAHVFTRKPADVRTVTALEDYPGLDFKTFGTQVVAPGSIHPDHPHGPPYAWAGKVLFTQVPDLPAEALARVTRPPRPPRSAGEHDEISPAYLKTLLARLNPCDFQEHDRWLQLMMACHAGTNGSDEARQVFIDWSTADPAYADDAGLIEGRWDSLEAGKADGVTVATLFKEVGPDKVPPPPAAEQFDIPPPETDEAGAEAGGADWVARMKRDRNMVPVASFENAVLGVRALGIDPSLDVWWGNIWLRGDLSAIQAKFPAFGPRFEDVHIGSIRMLLVNKWRLGVSKEMVFDAVEALASEAAVNPLVDWLRSLTWDGTPRLDQWLPTYTGCTSNAYTQAVGRLMLIAAVGRAMQPGLKFDQMIVFEGKQGIGKSRLVRALGQEFSSEGIQASDLRGRDQVEAIYKSWFCEVDELVGLRRADVNAMKSFLSRTSDRARLAYAKVSKDFDRRTILVGTTNEAEYLVDPSGARRFWPVLLPGLPGLRGKIDVEGFLAARDQIFAEAVARWNANPTSAALILPETAEAIAAGEQEMRYEEDSWADAIRIALTNVDKLATAEFLPTTDLIYFGLNKPFAEQTRTDRQRVGAVMSRLGWKACQMGPARVRGWRRP